MANNAHTIFRANDRSYFAILKKEIHALAKQAGLSDKRRGEVDLVVAEMATNLVKHGGGGQLFVKIIEEHNIPGIEIISMDNGQGMNDANKMIVDGASTKYTLGLGLGTMKRLSDFFQIYSLKDWGTIVLSRLFAREFPPYLKPPRADIRSIVIPKPGEQVSGDGFFTLLSKDYIKVFMGDGLGHGAEAEDVVQKAGAAFRECEEIQPCEIIRHINNHVRKTRGLVGSVAVFSVKEKLWRICGIGNITTRIAGPSLFKNYLAYNGIIGLNVPKTLNAQEIAYEKGQQLILCSDGIRSRWDLSKYTGITRYDLGILCAAVIKDFCRTTDDTAVAVVKINY